MGTSLLVFLVILNFSIPQVAQRSADFRQGQLENAIFTEDLPLLSEALDAKADPNHVIAMSPMRLQALGEISHRLGHYFAEETKATPLMIAAALGKRDVCEPLLRNGAVRYQASAWGWVPAQYAAKCGYPELAQSLFDSDPLAANYQLVVTITGQTVVLYKNGVPIVTGKISTGRKGFDTPQGRYLVTDKERSRRSSLYKVPMPYFLRLSFGEYGIHQGYNPGRPASHGCIRVGTEEAAKAIYEQTPIGTLVTIQ
jgi:lipoprotein-anchoring transpeptidase ErfK/SrfK